MRQILVFSLSALLLGAITIWFVQQDRGYILVSLGNTTIEMSFWMGVFIYLLSVLLILGLNAIRRGLFHVQGLRSWWVLRRRSKQMGKTATGLLLFLERDWQKSVKLLGQAFKNSDMPQVNLLYAATAAANNNQWDECQQLIEHLKSNYPEFTVQADLIWVDLLLEGGKFDHALKILRSLDKASPQNVAVLTLISSVYRHKEDWTALIDLLPLLKKLHVLTKQDLKELEVESYCGLLGAFSNHDSDDAEMQLQVLWSQVPKQHRQNAQILITYVDALVAIGEADQGLSLLSKGLQVQWQEELIVRYASIIVTDGKKQLVNAEKWLRQNPDNPHLLRALGQICLRLKFFGKARDYLKATIELAPSAESYLDLASVYGEMGKERDRHEAYKKGLELAIANQ